MKNIFLTALFAFNCLLINSQTISDYTQYVNPLVGTDSKYELSNGNTYPAIALPWGMNFWTPQTNKMGDGWGYQYASTKIRGFKQTHQPSPWINDYGAFSIFATTGKLVFDENKRESWFSHKAETSKPHYYSVYLADYNTTVEITPTERAACFRITYPKTDKAYLVVDAFFKNSFIEIDPANRKITGYACNNSGGVPDNFKNYFVIYVDKNFEEVFAVADSHIMPGSLEAKSSHSGAVIRFITETGEKVNLKIASSFISPGQAELNLQREIGNQSFDQVCEKAKSEWNQQLCKVAVEGGTDAQLTTFYTALYRTLLFPRKFYEYNQDGNIVHYSPYNGKVEAGYMFTDNGFWDTFRAVFPFFTLMYPELNSHIMEGLANAYKESGWLPEWASPGHRDCMIGSNSAVLIADSYLKGIPNKDINILYEAILKNSRSEGPIHSVGRYGVDYYNSLGYIPYNVGVNENTARTIEYSFADYTIYKLAKELKRPQSEIDLFAKRATNYKNVFDKSANFMRGRNADGSFQSPFRADKWGDAFTEGCSWHWTWCVFHDVQGLINLMGGSKPFTAKLDSVFVAPPTFDYSYYGFQIHEITEMLIMDMGQYAHGNQPIQHATYLYNYAGEPWKTQFHVREIMDKLYTPLPDGLCGDEDNGQTSAWYVFSAMGMYPVASATNQYVLGAPLAL
jgi:predicted alpha-1,2-mannosidase